MHFGELVAFTASSLASARGVDGLVCSERVEIFDNFRSSLFVSLVHREGAMPEQLLAGGALVRS
jgi:hypothetical protein